MAAGYEQREEGKGGRCWFREQGRERMRCCEP